MARSAGSVDIYEKFADEYDATRFECTCGKLQNETEIRIINDLVENSNRILDAGAGTGRLAIAMVRSSRSVVAVDRSRSMIARARKKADASALGSRVSFVQADVRSLPFKSSAFASVISIRVLSHYQVLDPMIAEFGRVLRPRGEVVLDASNPLAGIYRRLVPGVRCPTAVDFFHTVESLRKVMASKGIELSAIKTYSVLPPSVLHRAICMHFQERASGFLRKVVQTRHGLLAILQGVKRQ